MPGSPGSFRVPHVSRFPEHSRSVTLDHRVFREVNGLTCLHLSSKCGMSTLWPIGWISLQKGKANYLTGRAGAGGGRQAGQRRGGLCARSQAASPQTNPFHVHLRPLLFSDSYWALSDPGKTQDIVRTSLWWPYQETVRM